MLMLNCYQHTLNYAQNLHIYAHARQRDKRTRAVPRISGNARCEAYSKARYDGYISIAVMRAVE